MRRYWVDKQAFVSAPEVGVDVILSGDSFHHICDVCRQEEGNHFEVLIGDGKAYLVQIKSRGKKSATAVIKEVREVAALPGPKIHLCQCLPRFQKMDLIVEKSVELGVHQIHPFYSDYSFVRSASKCPSSRVERWRKIAKNATQQCGRGELMDFAEPVPVTGLVEKFNQSSGAAGLFLYEGEAERDLKSALTDIKSASCNEIWAFVGSEGGFSEGEVRMFGLQGLKSITMGPQVLRVETACLALISVIKYEFEAMK